MPLPTNDPVAFKGVPSLGGNKKMALTVTFTQKQVEAMFQRHEALRAQGSSQCPLEIDFDDNKVYIGDIATPFARVKENGTREICQRSPTVSKPLAAITLAGNVIGKLNIQRDYDQDLAANIRKVTEAEVSKRKERHIVRLDSPPDISSRKKSKPGSGASSLAKKAMTNRIVSTRPAPDRTSAPTPPAAPAVTPKSTLSHTRQNAPPNSSLRSAPPNSSSRPPTSSSSNAQPASSSSSVQPTPSSSSVPEPDLTSLRSHMIHYLAFEPRTVEDVLLKLGGPTPSSETRDEIETTLIKVAEKMRRPKSASSGPAVWQLLPRSWEEIRPYQYGSLSDPDRKKLARKGRLSLGSTVDSSDPLWEHLRSDFDSSVASSSTNDKGKGKSTASGPLVKTSDFKGGMFPKEKKTGSKGGGVAGGGVTKKKTTSKAKAKKEQEEEIEYKTRKVVVALDDTKSRSKASVGSSAITTNKQALMEDEDKEEDAIPLNVKSKQPLATSKREDAPLKSRRAQDDANSSKRKITNEVEEGSSDMEEGELPAKPTKKRKLVTAANKPRPTPRDRNETPTDKGSKEKEQISNNDGNGVPNSSVTGLSSKTPALPGSKALKLGKEKERDRQEREALENERPKDREREKRHPSGKRPRRPTPAFSSDEEEEVEAKPPPPQRATKTKVPTQPSGVPKSSVSASNTPRAPSPVLPSDKEGLRRRYNSCYTRYMGVTFKLHEQRTKIEAALQMDGDSVSADDSMDIMDTEQLMQLRGEHERLREELEQIQCAYAVAF